MGLERTIYYDCTPDNFELLRDGTYLLIRYKDDLIQIPVHCIKSYDMSNLVSNKDISPNLELTSAFGIGTDDEEHMFGFKFSYRHKVLELYDRGFEIINQILQSP
jgi:hypothetical protein